MKLIEFCWAMERLVDNERMSNTEADAKIILDYACLLNVPKAWEAYSAFLREEAEKGVYGLRKKRTKHSKGNKSRSLVRG